MGLFSPSGDPTDTTSPSPEVDVSPVTADPSPAPFTEPDLFTLPVPTPVPAPPKETLEIPEGKFKVVLEDKATKSLLKLKHKDTRRFGKVMKSIGFLAEHGPDYPTLRTTKMVGTDRLFSFAENGTPGAWRLYWTWGPASSQILLIDAAPALS